MGSSEPCHIRKEDLADREVEGVLLVPKAGEMLSSLKQQPTWAGGEVRSTLPLPTGQAGR